MKMRLKPLVPVIIGLSQFKPFVITTLSFFLTVLHLVLNKVSEFSFLSFG